MIPRDKFIPGMLLGCLLPMLAWATNYFFCIYKYLFIGRESVILISVVINLVIIRFYFKMHKTKIASGLFLSSFVIVMLIFILKY